MGEITRLDEELFLPNPQPGQDIDYEYMRVLVGKLNDLLGSETNATVNLLLDQQGDTAIIYLGIPNGDGVYPNGTWRIKVNDDGELDRDKKVDGSWVTVLTDDV